MKFKFTVVLIIVALSLAIGITASFNDHTYLVTITDKERITYTEGSSDKKEVKSKYLVFCDDQNGDSLVFENTDNLFCFKFNSSNIQGELKTGNQYLVTVVGWRIPILSFYENIVKLESR